MAELVSKKGQVSMEFIISVLLLLLIFIYCISIFQSRSDLNVVSNQKWAAEEKAYQIARNINNVYLLDDNATIRDIIVWNESGQSAQIDNKTIQVYYENTFSDAPLITAGVVWNIVDLNGEIYFKKINGRVIVDYS